MDLFFLFSSIQSLKTLSRYCKETAIFLSAESSESYSMFGFMNDLMGIFS